MDFEAVGKRIGALGLHTLVVQEGGYYTRNLGVNARHFFRGLWAGAFGEKVPGNGKGKTSVTIQHDAEKSS